GGDQSVDTVEGDAAVVADDAAAAVGVGQARDDAGRAAGADLGGVGVEDALVVGLAEVGVDLLDLGIGLVAIGVEGAFDHAPAAVRHDRALEGAVGLEADDEVLVVGRVAVDVAGLEGVDTGRG